MNHHALIVLTLFLKVNLFFKMSGLKIGKILIQMMDWNVRTLDWMRRMQRMQRMQKLGRARPQVPSQ